MKSLLFIAVLPSVLLMYFIYKKDKVEKEPLGLLMKMFFLEALSCLWVIYAEKFAGMVNDTFFGNFPDIHTIFRAFIGVALIEEFSKYLVLKKMTWEADCFNCRFDAVVYSVFTTLGFATFENILYVFDYGFKTGVMRAIISVPAHMMFGVCMGIYYGTAKYYSTYSNKSMAKRNLIYAIIMPTLLHGFFDYCLFVETTFSIIVFYLFVICMYVVSFRNIKRYSDEDFYFNVHDFC